ncbi:hypothetical protein [Vibrio alginolyticus]|nr:hypothetical protein [Vibrio parahaemolyticus]
MQISDWISLGSSVGSLVAALIALVSLLELIRQRKSSFKPDLTILASTFKIKHENESDSLPLFWENDESHDDLQLVNVGLGVAKNLEVRWKYDAQKMLNKAIDGFPQNSTYNGKVTVEDNIVQLVLDPSNIPLPMMFGETSNLAYIIPVSVSSESYYLPIPTSYKILVSLWVSNRFSHSMGWDFDDIEPLELILSYWDVGDYKHQEKLNIKPKFKMSSKSDNKPRLFTVEFDMTPYT